MNSNEQAGVKINLDSEQARARLRQINEELEKLRATIGSKDLKGEALKEAKANLKALTDESKALKKELAGRIQVIIDGKAAATTTNEIHASIKRLRSEIGTLTIGTQEFVEKSKRLSVLKQQLDAATGAARNTESAFDKLKSGLGALGIAAGLYQLFQLGKDSFRAFGEAEKGVVLLKNQITIMGGESVQKFRDLEEQAAKLAGVFDDDAIMKAQLYFAQYGFGADTIKKITPVLNDFAAATGQTIEDAARKIGLAVGGNGRGMREFGITVDDTGSKAQNLEQILGKLSDKFEGQAEIIQTTTLGSYERFKIWLHETQEFMGGAFIETLEFASHTIQKFFDPFGTSIKDAIKQTREEAAATKQAILSNLAELDENGLQKYYQRDVNALRVAQKQKAELLQQAPSAARDAQLKQLKNDTDFFTLSSQLAEKEIKNRADKIKEGNDDETKAAEAKRDKAKAIAAKVAEDTKNIINKIAELQAAAIADEEQRELAAAAAKYSRDLQDIEQSKASAQLKNTALLALQDSFEKEKSDIAKKYQQKRDQDNFQSSLTNLASYNIQVQFADVDRLQKGEITQQQYNDLKQQHEQQFLDGMLSLYEEFGKQETAEGRRAAIATAQARIQALQKGLTQEHNDVLAARQRAVIEAQGDGERELAAKKALRTLQYEQEKADTAKSEEEKKLAKAQFDADIEAMETEHVQRMIHDAERYAQAWLNVLDAANKNAQIKDQKELSRQRTLADQKKKELKDQLDHGLISHEEYEARVLEIDAGLDKESVKIKKKQFESQKKYAIIQATIATILSVAQALATPPSPNIVLGAIAAVLGGIQIALIAGQEAPEFEHGITPGEPVVLKGPAHSSKYKGMPVTDPSTGEVKALFEGNEMLVPKNVVENNPQLAPAIQDAHFNNGGVLRMPVFSPSYPSSAVVRQYASGIYSAPAGGTDIEARAGVNFTDKRLDALLDFLDSIGAVIRQSNTLMQQHQQSIDELNTQLKQGIKSDVVLTELELKQKQLAALREFSKIA